MRILVLNAGSSSLKFSLIDVLDAGPADRARGIVERIGSDATLSITAPAEHAHKRGADARDHGAAFRIALQALDDLPDTDITSSAIDGVGHRVVHGGARFTRPTPVDDALIEELEELSALAPLHNPAAIGAIRASRELLPRTPMVAVFDTSFHSSMPPHAAAYALPHTYFEERGVRRYGFHGIAHDYMLRRYCVLSGTARDRAKIITLQLGNGCSACAIRDGRSVDTSMGFTPLEGLVMGTRAGDLDPGVLLHLLTSGDMTPQRLDDLLNNRSGLLGLSGLSRDMRDLLSARDRHPRAALAVDAFCYRLRKYIGAYMAALDGAQAVVFGGGIGENAAAIRAQVLSGMEWAGLRIDPARNEETVGGKEGPITQPDSPVAAYVVRVDEDTLIAEETYACLSSGV